jgi:hypothetical protein
MTRPLATTSLGGQGAQNTTNLESPLVSSTVGNDNQTDLQSGSAPIQRIDIVKPNDSAGLPTQFAARVPATDVAFVIMTGKEHFETRVKWIQETWLTWLSDHPATFFVSENVEGATPPGTRFIETNDTCCGYYPSQRKWRESLIEMMKPGFLPESVKWLWVADDDSFVVVPNALRFLADKDPNERRVYGEMCAELRGYTALCGGATWVAPIFVMKELAAWLLTVPWPVFDNEVLSDRIFSKAMRDLLSVTLVDTKEFVSQPPMFVFDNPHNVPYKTAGWGHAVSFHYMKEPDMRMVMKLYEAFQPT